MDLDSVAKLYSRSLAEHGVTPRGVGWGDEDTHRLRFEKLSAVIADLRTPVTINDLGCGYGALYEYLSDRSVTVSHYRGYEISDEMIAEARRRLPRDGVELVLGSTLSAAADYSFASGIFNVRLERDEESWQGYVLETLDRMHEHSEKGFAFNLLSSYVDYREDHLYYGDPCFFFDHCKRRYSRYVTLLHDYPLWEWTMLVRR